MSGVNLVHKPQIVKKFEYKPISPLVERLAFQAAHRIAAADTMNPSLATPSARHRHKVDAIAEIIRSTFEGVLKK